MSVKCIPLTPHFYMVKLQFSGVYMYQFFIYLLQNIDCGYSLESPRRGVSNVHIMCTYNLCFEQKTNSTEIFFNF